MKRVLAIILTALMLTSLAACGNNSQAGAEGTQTAAENAVESAAGADSVDTEAAQETTNQEEEIQEESAPAEAEAPTDASALEETAEGDASAQAAHSDVLVAFFSATGTTKGVAEKIASVTGGDLYEILAAEPYTSEDLNYNDSSTRATKEQDDASVRPAIGSEDISLEGYTTIYVGFPIWWGEEPRIMDTFVEKYSFDGITVIPFCTSGSSGIGRSGSNMEALAGSGTWLEGKRFGGNVSEEELQSWIEGLKFDALSAHYKTLVRYINFRDCGMVLGLGCGTPGMTRRSGYPQEAYLLGRNL